MAKRSTYQHKLTKRDKNAFDKKMSTITSQGDPEKAVEGAINRVVTQFFDLPESVGETINSYPLKTDGVVTITHGESTGLFGEKTNTYRILIETKSGRKFSANKKHVAQTVAQVVYYLKQFRDAGDIVPKVVIIADEDEIFYLPTSALVRYLDTDYNWESYSPSSMHTNTAIMEDLVGDNNISPAVEDITSDFSIEDFLSEVSATLYEDDSIIKVPVTVETMTKLFMDFNHDVFEGVFEPVDNQQQLAMFFRYLAGGDNTYLHPKKKNILVLDGSSVTLPSKESRGKFERFFNRIDTNFTTEELDALTTIYDQGIINDKMRRFHGDFFTPTVWANKAHQVIEDALGEDWREKYVVVDPACGTKNLTRDYDFRELYSMTLHQEELDVSSGYNVGEGCVAQQYDFLNDDVLEMHGGLDADGNRCGRPTKGGKKALNAWLESRPSADDIMARAEEIARYGGKAFGMPMGLLRALYEKKPIVWFTNPPYGSNGNGTKTDGRKGDIANTALNGVMPQSYGHAKKDLCTQFIYRVQLLSELFGYEEDFHVLFFSFAKFLPSPSFEAFKQSFFDRFSLQDGFLMNAGEFSGTSSAWGITFSHWEIGGSDQREFDYPVMESVDGGGILETGVWQAQAVGKGETISDWVKSIETGDKSQNHPFTRNGLDAPSAIVRGKVSSDAIGFCHNHGFNVQYSEKYIGLYSFGFGAGQGFSITPNNLLRAVATFSIRRSVYEDMSSAGRLWCNWESIFRAPSGTLSDDDTFLIDCLVYSLFDHKARQTSLRDYDYNGSTYTIVNEFFPWSRDSIKELAISAIKDKGLTDFRDVERDITQHGKKERLVHTTLEKAKKEGHLSTEAQSLLDASWKLVEESFNDRTTHAEDFPRYQSANWDAGWLQIRSMLWGRDRVSDDYLDEKPQWDEKLRTLGDKIAQRAYADGIIGAPDAGVSATEEPSAAEEPAAEGESTPAEA